MNHAVVNEDPNARIIRELRAEVDALKEMLKHASVSQSVRSKSEMGCNLIRYFETDAVIEISFQQPEVLREKLSENEKLMKEISLTWEEKLLKTGASLIDPFS